MENITVVETKKPSKVGRITLVYLSSIVLGIVFAPFLTKLYIYIFPPLPLSGLYGFDVDPNHLSGGFLIGYIFFLSLLVVFLEPQKRFWTWFWGIILFLVITLGEWKYFGFNLLISLIGYIIGFGVLYLKNRIGGMKRVS